MRGFQHIPILIAAGVLAPATGRAQDTACTAAACCPACPRPPQQHDRRPPGIPGCAARGWTFGDPARPESRSAFLAFANGVTFLTDHRAARAGVTLVNGRPGPWGTIEPYANGRGVPFARLQSVEGAHGCNGMLMARVVINGLVSVNPDVRAAAQSHRDLLRRADSTHSLEWSDSADATGGYKSYPHCHRFSGGTCVERHRHALYPEGTSYVWVDRIRDDGAGGFVGRAVIVPADPRFMARVVRLRYCGHAAITASTPGDEPCGFHGAIDVNVDMAAWLPHPNDEHLWGACSSSGCCRVSDEPVGPGG